MPVQRTGGFALLQPPSVHLLAGTAQRSLALMGWSRGMAAVARAGPNPLSAIPSSLCPGPVLPLKDPTSDLAVIARAGSKLVKEVREKKDKDKGR